MAAGGFEYCYSCGDFPCVVLLHLDKRYRLKYATSAVENLRTIQKIGLSKFARSEIQRWTCPQCGGTLCMHDPECPGCGYRWNNGIPVT